MPYLLVSRPCYDTYEYDNVVSVENMFLHTSKQGVKVCYHWPKGSNIAINRNLAVDKARELGADHILWIDSDVIVQSDFAVRLVAHDVPIVSGVVVGKQAPYVVVAGRLTPKGYSQIRSLPANELLRDLDGVGGGLLLVKMEVFDKIDKPYFCFEPNPDGSVKGEDYYFCAKAKAAGFEICLDTSVISGHIGTHIYSIEDTNNFNAYEMYRQTKEQNRIVDMAKRRTPLITTPNGKVLVN